MSEPHYLAIWEFRVRPDSVAEFERIYGRDGLWAQLFRQSSKYLGTELIRDLEGAGRYLTIDRWTSREALQRFKQAYAAKYSELDKACEKLTETEASLGDFEGCSPGLPTDLSTNPRHFQGFGKSGP